MQIRRLNIKHFRSISDGELLFSGHTAMIGGNSVGKSTICEALDLLLGPDRLSRASAIDEHDFHGRKYLDQNNEPVAIELEVVLTDLTHDLETKYRTHREYWNTETNKLLDEENELEDIESDNVIPALRIRFEGKYDIEEDEFKAQTFFASPPPQEGQNPPIVSRRAKRQFGFIYLRALRTGARALSLERGSLLDIILRLKDEDRSAMWEQTLHDLENLDPAIDEISQLKDILESIDERVRNFVGLSEEDRAFRLFPSALTRESLRKTITLFGASERSNTPVPYWRLGSGIVNAMVFSLLTFIAELKKNVIFAMEEPELAIPPHTQRRIVQFLKKSVDQTILTTHSPFVLEQFEPEDVLLLQRNADCDLEGKQVEVTGIKAKTYKGSLRRIFAEAMLGQAVICVEGVSDSEVLRSASTIIESHEENDIPYTPLDLSGATIVQCQGDGSILRYGEFFSNLGLKTYAFYDSQKNEDIVSDIANLFDGAWELKQTGIEKLLVDELPIARIQRFLEDTAEWDDYPNGDKFEYNEDCSDSDARKVAFKVLKARKGAGYAKYLTELCDKDDLPEIIIEALLTISSALPDDLLTAVSDNEENDDSSDE